MSEYVEQLPLPSMRIGEGPHWIEDQQALLVADVFKKTLRKYYTETRNTEVLRIDGTDVEELLSMAVPVEGVGGLWVVGLGKTLSAVRWPASDPGSHTFLGHTVSATTLHTTNDYHFNDAKCDPKGRLWAGTMSKVNDDLVPLNPRSCHLFKYDHNLQISTLAKDVTLSNGMAWSSDKKHFYYADSYTGCIYHFDYDNEEGIISGQSVLFDFKEAGLKEQVPDGMTIDCNDNLWVASFTGGQVLCVDPRKGAVVREVKVPASYTTSVCWGGKDYSTLYVTSGTFNMTKEQCAAQPSAGGTFAITGLGIKGSPPVSFKPDLKKLREKIDV